MIYELNLPGAPLIGWHFDCEDGDPLFIRVTTSGAGNVVAAAVRIGRRGQDRVIARRAWWDLFADDDDAQGVEP